MAVKKSNLKWRKIWFLTFLTGFFSVLFLALIKGDYVLLLIYAAGFIGGIGGVGASAIYDAFIGGGSLLIALLLYWSYNALDFSHLHLLLLSILASLITNWAYRKVSGRETPFKYIQYKRLYNTKDNRAGVA